MIGCNTIIDSLSFKMSNEEFKVLKNQLYVSNFKCRVLNMNNDNFEIKEHLKRSD